MKTTLYIFRHGQTDWNAEERFQGHLDIPLNETGKRQAQDLVPVLTQSSIEAILSSDLSRAVETATIIARSLRISVFQDAGLREAHLGEAEGLTRPEIEKKLGFELVSKWKSSQISDADISYPGGETGNQVADRVFETLKKFLISHPHYLKVGVATHGGVIRRVMQRLLPPNSPSVPIPNAVLYSIFYDPKLDQFSTTLSQGLK